MAKVMNKIMGFMGLEDEIEEMEEEEVKKNGEEFMEPVITSNKKANNKDNNKVLSIHTGISAKVSIVKPESYEDAANICDDLKNRKIVVVNTSKLDPKIAQRLLDFMGGASYALGGELSEVEKGVYIVSPTNVEVSNELKSELSSKGVFSWSK